jgi:hypothetical protein
LCRELGIEPSSGESDEAASVDDMSDHGSLGGESDRRRASVTVDMLEPLTCE